MTAIDNSRLSNPSHVSTHPVVAGKLHLFASATDRLAFMTWGRLSDARSPHVTHCLGRDNSGNYYSVSQYRAEAPYADAVVASLRGHRIAARLGTARAPAAICTYRDAGRVAVFMPTATPASPELGWGSRALLGGLPTTQARGLGRVMSMLCESVANMHAHGLAHTALQAADVFVINGRLCIDNFAHAVEIIPQSDTDDDARGLSHARAHDDAWNAPEITFADRGGPASKKLDSWGVGLLCLHAMNHRPFADYAALCNPAGDWTRDESKVALQRIHREFEKARRTYGVFTTPPAPLPTVADSECTLTIDFEQGLQRLRDRWRRMWAALHTELNDTIFDLLRGLLAHDPDTRLAVQDVHATLGKSASFQGVPASLSARPDLAQLLDAHFAAAVQAMQAPIPAPAPAPVAVAAAENTTVADAANETAPSRATDVLPSVPTRPARRSMVPTALGCVAAVACTTALQVGLAALTVSTAAQQYLAFGVAPCVGILCGFAVTYLARWCLGRRAQVSPQQISGATSGGSTEL